MKMLKSGHLLNRIKAMLMKESLGLGLRPGAHHYRAYVGQPEDYDLIASSKFNLLTTLGLRQYHTVLDIGCGSLRIGRLLIPYLNVGNYVGIEPNKWLVDDGIQREIGQDQIRIKQPQFYFSDSAIDLPSDERFDFAIAIHLQSLRARLGGAMAHGELRPSKGVRCLGSDVFDRRSRLPNQRLGLSQVHLLQS